MRIEVLAMAYNEAFLLPFFLGHYSWADRINVLYDEDSTDDSLEILRSSPLVRVIPFRFPDKMDDTLKAAHINALYQTLQTDWVVAVDADEFVPFPTLSSDFDVLPVSFWEVFRHETDDDLDPESPPLYQRRHGNPVQGQSYGIGGFTKPIIVRGGLSIQWGPGCHELQGEARVSEKPWWGAHWGMADPCFCVTRRCRDRRDRQSQWNLDARMTIQHHHITEAEVLAECERHRQDPLLF